MAAVGGKIIFLWATVAALLLLSAWVLEPFMLALSLGGIFAVALSGIHDKLMRSCRLPAGVASFLVCFVLMCVILASLGVVVTKGVSYFRGNSDIGAAIDHLKSQIFDSLLLLSRKFHYPVTSEHVGEMGRSLAASAQGILAKAGRSLIANTMGMALQLFVMLLTMFILLKNRVRIGALLLSYKGLSRRRMDRIKRIFAESCRDVVVSNLITGGIQAGMVAGGAATFSTIDAALVFIVTFITSFIPVIGASPIAGLLAAIEFLQGRYGNGLALLILMLIVGVADNIVRAWLMTKEPEDSPFVNLLACIGGIYAWGIPGIFLGPMAMSLTRKVVPILFKEMNRASRRGGRFASAGENRYARNGPHGLSRATTR